MTCRAGRPGSVVSIVSGRQEAVVQRFARKLGVELKSVEFSHGAVAGVESTMPQGKAAAAAAAAEE